MAAVFQSFLGLAITAVLDALHNHQDDHGNNEHEDTRRHERDVVHVFLVRPNPAG